MGQCKDPYHKEVLNKRQNALKVSANSVYGFLKANTLPRPEIAETVTAYGRFYIMLAKHIVEEHFTVAHGYKFNAVVKYGDTDSIFVDFGPLFMEEISKLAFEAVGLINAAVPKPMEIQFEKVYRPWIFWKKKKYAGIEFEPLKNGTFKDKGIGAKGLVTVRREICKLAKQTVNTCLNIVLKVNFRLKIRVS